jgi:tetratricopeptide (TPR) repeat protein
MNLKNYYNSLKIKGKKAIELGNFQEAENYFRQCLEVARKMGCDELKDLSICNLCAALIEQNRWMEPEISELKFIYLRTKDKKTSRLASYHLARAKELEGDFQKALFYANISLNLSIELKNNEYLSSSYNQIGNLYTCQSYFKEAEENYRKALIYCEKPILKSLITDNLGYVLIVQGKVKEGINLCEEALNMLKNLEAEDGYLIYPYMDLCLGYLEDSKPEKALKYGKIALEIAEKSGFEKRVKNILLLLGEASALAGEINLAQSYYGELATYYPSIKLASDFLMAFELRKVVNFRL